jgi:hypothetical protein
VRFVDLNAVKAEPIDDLGRPNAITDQLTRVAGRLGQLAAQLDLSPTAERALRHDAALEASHRKWLELAKDAEVVPTPAPPASANGTPHWVTFEGKKPAAIVEPAPARGSRANVSAHSKDTGNHASEEKETANRWASWVGPVSRIAASFEPRGINAKLGCNLSKNIASRQTGIVSQGTNACAAG